MDYNNNQQFNNNQNIPPQGQPYQGQQIPPQGMPPQGMYNGAPAPGSIPQDPGYYQWMQLQEQNNNRKANIMCTISLVLALLGTFGITIFTAIFGPGLNPNMEISEGFSLLFQRSGGLFVYGPLLMRITALILMIVARVKYPKNTFAKVLMWLYIAFYILYILLIIAVISFFAWFMTQCAAY